jgi:hypothetical protein
VRGVQVAHFRNVCEDDAQVAELLTALAASLAPRCHPDVSLLLRPLLFTMASHWLDKAIRFVHHLSLPSILYYP